MFLTFLRAARDDRDQLAVHAGSLSQLADLSLLRLFARVDAALRHLPRIARRIESLADEDAPVAVCEHHSGAGAIGKVAVVVHAVASAIIVLSTARLPLTSTAALGMALVRQREP